MYLKALAAALISALVSTAAHAVTVDATSDIFAAGVSSIPSGDSGNGTAPAYISVTAGQTLVITASGTVYCCDTAPPPPNGVGIGPNGFNPNPFSSATPPSTIYANADLVASGSTVGTYTGDAFALAGVFNTPGAIPFEIGTSKTVVVPTGATMLYFGFADASGFNGPSGYYDDNTGFLTVTAAVPEPSTWAMLMLGFAGIGFMAYRRQNRTSALTAA